ncbi:hypothetical protein RUM43_015065 [Polyplax serrata]|uniref:Uncharacterized protein n=1 Tax=Polyplax serrata TaxID=468196 RepID=A0AAN8PFP0_POLSC
MSSELCPVTRASLVQERVPNTPGSGTKDRALRYPPPPTPQNVIIPCSLRGARESGQLERISTSPGGQSTRSIAPLPFMFRKVCELKGLMSDMSRLSEVDQWISGVPNDQDQDNVVEPMSLQPSKSEMGCSMGLLGLDTCIHGEFLRVQLR